MPNTPPERFSRYVAEAARAAGYDLDGPRGGGRKALAEAAGLSASAVSRTLAGQTLPELSSFRPLARALEVSTEDLLRAAGVLDGEAGGPAPLSLTATEAARRLGIRAVEHIAAFKVLVSALQRAEDSSQG
ncbi:helix-turn-helix domain-containing protein [Streptomyces chartreusis]|uniref:helix-turn-helix domain-containing protein n=1 Tax=Streptomyces chartreusis TaxID=1969 RepID=UPI0033F7FC17